DEFGADFLKYNENGEIEITFTWSDVPSFYRYILTFGDMAEIIEPPEYRREFSELLKKIQKNY
ncbi:MAG: WYL domain-containing protein, partial [Clostridia bacterium]|nr:WYL domain-containing protein [Clostridia bacterium]